MVEPHKRGGAEKGFRKGEVQWKSVPGRDRTCDEKGLRDRNSPMCTLSQNGYGDIGWSTKILPTLAAAQKSSIPLAVLSPPPQSPRGVTSDLDHPRTVRSLPSLATSNIEMNRITKLSPRIEIGNFAHVGWLAVA